jgi:DNA-binding response OmpR family regulator
LRPGRTSAVHVLVLADDLIWSTRLVAQVRAADAEVTSVRTLAAFEAGLTAADAAIVDLTARAYDGISAIARAAAAGKRVLAVGQHDDVELRKRALAAGAQRVHPYRKLFEDGPATLAKWLNPVAEASAR